MAPRSKSRDQPGVEPPAASERPRRSSCCANIGGAGAVGRIRRTRPVVQESPIVRYALALVLVLVALAAALWSLRSWPRPRRATARCREGTYSYSKPLVLLRRPNRTVRPVRTASSFRRSWLAQWPLDSMVDCLLGRLLCCQNGNLGSPNSHSRSGVRPGPARAGARRSDRASGDPGRSRCALERVFYLRTPSRTSIRPRFT